MVEGQVSVQHFPSALRRLLEQCRDDPILRPQLERLLADASAHFTSDKIVPRRYTEAEIQLLVEDDMSEWRAK